jgi:hypothetical protein
MFFAYWKNPFANGLFCETLNTWLLFWRIGLRTVVEGHSEFGFMPACFIDFMDVLINCFKFALGRYILLPNQLFFGWNSLTLVHE